MDRRQADGDLTTALCSLSKIISEDGQEYVQLYDVLETVRRYMPSVAIPPEHDGCKDCVYQANPQDAMPCRECKQNYMDKWKAIPPAEPKTDVLDKIRAEIKEYQKDAFYSNDVMMSRKMVLDIIDKYKAESEDKE